VPHPKLHHFRRRDLAANPDPIGRHLPRPSRFAGAMPPVREWKTAAAGSRCTSDRQPLAQQCPRPACRRCSSTSPARVARRCRPLRRDRRLRSWRADSDARDRLPCYPRAQARERLGRWVGCRRKVTGNMAQRRPGRVDAVAARMRDQKPPNGITATGGRGSGRSSARRSADG
jgi:hypothetical protein